VLTFHVSLADERYPEDMQVQAFYSRLLERLSKLHGIEAAVISSGLPLKDGLHVQTYRIEGEPPQLHDPETDVKLVSDYFRAVRSPILRGRASRFRRPWRRTRRWPCSPSHLPDRSTHTAMRSDGPC
jgi:hypothetical protein